MLAWSETVGQETFVYCCPFRHYDGQVNSTLKYVFVEAGDTAWLIKVFVTKCDNLHGQKGGQTPRKRKKQLL